MIYRNTWRHPVGHPQHDKLQRSKYWSYEFLYKGQRVRGTTNTADKATALRIERERRRSLELGTVGIDDEPPPPALTFAQAAKQYIEMGSAHWSERNLQIEQYNVDALLPFFGKMSLPDIKADHITLFQVAQKKRPLSPGKRPLSPRTINMAVGTMRSILRRNKLWAFLEQDVRMLTVRNEIGRALSPDEVFRLLTACKQSRSRSLYVAVLVSLHTGLRNGELRSMLWRQVDLIGNDEFPNGSVTVGRSKTEGGSGRRVPLSPDALACLKAWRTQFPACAPSHCLFPSEGYCANGSTPGAVHGTDVFTPILSWKTGWTVARKAAKVEARWHDLRHTFVSSLAAGQASDATIKALSGHVSNKMLERYSHTRNEAKCAAIAAAFGSQSLGSPRVSPKGDSAEDLKIQ